MAARHPRETLEKWAIRLGELVFNEGYAPPGAKVAGGEINATTALVRELGYKYGAMRKHVREMRKMGLQRHWGEGEVSNLPRTTAVKTAAKRGAFGYGAVLPGYEIASTSERRNADGELMQYSVQQRQERGEEFAVPDGHGVKGVSALLDGEGRVINRWVKTNREPSPDDVAQTITRAFENFKPCAPQIIRPEDDADRVAVYPWADWHIGLFAWGAETGQSDWDLKIGRKAIRENFMEVAEATPKAGLGVVLGLGDLMHIDNTKSATPTSNNYLDSDTRYSKIMDATIDTIVACSEIARRRHHKIKIILKPGNHDEVSTVGMQQALRMYYRNDDNAEVDTSPNHFYCERFGVNMVCGCHGDKAKPKDLPMIMANRWPDDWAASTTRHAHTGHIHHDTLNESHGVHTYSHRAPVAQDAYHAWKGYLSGRSMRSFLYHVDRGFRLMNEVEIQ